MRFLKLVIVLTMAATLVVGIKNDESKSRDKRQGQVAFYPRRGPRPPPYAVQMEPIVQYSQRDPLYNSRAKSKSDDFGYPEGPIAYYPEPEPIIEIIIKESNETLPTPVPPPAPQVPRPTKEPIQVFYVKYEKKQGPGDTKPRVVYDTPVPALNPVEEHEEGLEPTEHGSADSYAESVPLTTPAPREPSTTLRTVIRPESEVYHAGSSGIRVTFGTEQLPPNQHSKRDDHEAPSPTPHLANSRPVAASKRQHGPYQPLQPFQRNFQHQRVPPALAQQRVVNSFPSAPSNAFPQRPPFSAPTEIRGPSRRLPITIQGLPEVQQRVPFNAFVPPHRVNVNHPQQSGLPPTLSISHQNVHLQNQPGLPPQPTQQSLPNLSHLNPFNAGQLQSQQYQKQQELEKQRYFEQRKQQDLTRQQEQRRQQEHQRQLEQQRAQEQQLRQEQQRVQEQQRLQREFEQKQLQEQLQYRQQIESYNQQLRQASQRPGSEILKAVPKLEQHYAIRENPLHPGPFPPNPQPTDYPEVSQTSFRPSQQQNELESQQFVRPSQQVPVDQHPSNGHLNNAAVDSLRQQSYSNSQQFFSQNLPTPHQQQLGSTSASSIWGSPVFRSQNPSQKIYATPASNSLEPQDSYFTSSRPIAPVTSPTPTTRTPSTTTTTTTTTTPSPKSEEKIKANIANLPDEVPDDIRQQLLSSGILGNADIQILDYDKVGDIPIENLPPEALANFYGAGGGAAVASGSEPVPAIVQRPRTVAVSDAKSLSKKSPKVEQATLRPGGVEMKVVHFDPNTAQGQAVADQHIRDDATHLDPVKIGPKDSSQYNRYLPLKVSGAAFPLPDVPELNGRKITSVVVLAPVDYNFHGNEKTEEQEGTRHGRKTNDVQAVKFLAGDALKQVVKKPTAENYKKWLEQERRTDPQRQSVVLLVTMPADGSNGEKEIFMYDVTSHAISKLAGDLSSAFVDVAESNSGNDEAQTDV